jgi:ssDNA-binding Zn-finger/Zn-ribbon topoisomerase 1
MHCPKCGTAMRIYRITDTYPIKLPGCCPCCLSQILSYTPEVADES